MTATLDGSTIFSVQIPLVQVGRGFVAVGTETFARADFDNIVVTNVKFADFISIDLTLYSWTNTGISQTFSTTVLVCSLTCMFLIIW